MPARSLPNLGLQGFFDLGEDGWKDEMDLNLLKLSVLTQGGAISKVSATPGSPANGDVHIFDETHPTNANAVAIRDAGAWVYVNPAEGWLIYNRATNAYETFNGTAWAALATGGSGISGIRVEDESAAILASATALNFAGAGVLVTDAGGGEALVTIPGASGGISGIRIEEEGVSTVAVSTAINFAGAGVTVTDAGAGEALVTIPSGGGSSLAYFNGSTASGVLVNTGTNATKGAIFTPEVEIKITHVHSVIDSAVAGDTYRIEIWSVTGLTVNGAGTVTAVSTATKIGEASTPISANSTSETPLRFQLNSPLTVAAGTNILVVTVLANAAGGTTSLRQTVGSWARPNYPGALNRTLLQFNTIGLSASQSPVSFGGTTDVLMWLEGTFSP